MIRKAVIPVAGLGTRFLPATKAIPKELLPLVDVPSIQVIVEELVSSGIEQIILVTGRGKSAIVDHFDRSYELEDILVKRGKEELVEQLRRISSMVHPIAIRQKAPLGLGHAILSAKDVVGDEPFAVVLPDDIITSEVPATRQLIDRYDKYGVGIVALMEVGREALSSYGIVGAENLHGRDFRVNTLIEKPTPEQAPSNLAVIGRYILPPSIFAALESTPYGHGGELQLTDALQVLTRSEGLVGYKFAGDRHDIGDKLGFLKANVSMALEREDLGPAFKNWLLEKLNESE